MKRPAPVAHAIAPCRAVEQLLARVAELARVCAKVSVQVDFSAVTARPQQVAPTPAVVAPALHAHRPVVEHIPAHAK